jgi:DNA-binding response OmpR family regulator
VPERDGRTLVLVVDDEPVFMRVVTSLLESDGHAVVQATDGESALAAIERQAPDLIILDVEMPGMNGLELLTRLRPRVAVPVIVVSVRDTESDRVIALDLGGDDYVVKPFLLREFAARVRAALRRGRAASETVLVFPSLEVRLVAREVLVDERPVALTPREFDLLAYLASRPGHVVSRRELLADVWHSSEDWQDAATVTEHVRRVRRKIEGAASPTPRIRTVRNVGYIFEA